MDLALDAVLKESLALNDALLDHLESAAHDGTTRYTTSASFCGIAMEHADSLRKLVASGNYTSAVALLRLQFEALTRAIWVLFAASETWLSKLESPLTPESEKAAGDSPSMNEMLTAIGVRGAARRRPDAGGVQDYLVEGHQFLRTRRNSSAAMICGRIPGAPDHPNPAKLECPVDHGGHGGGDHVR